MMSAGMSTGAGARVKKDVLVVGGGTAGFVAAIAAARNGASALLVESEDYLGGTQTGAMVMGIWSLRRQRHTELPEWTQQANVYPDEQVIFGMAQEFLDRLIKAKAAWGQPGKATLSALFDPEMAKWVIDGWVTESGVEVWLNSRLTGVLKTGSRVHGGVIKVGSRDIEVEAGVTIDATGDGWAAVYAGAESEKGRPEDGLCQPLSLVFTIGGVNMDATIKYMQDDADEFGREYVEQVTRLKNAGRPFTLAAFRSKLREAAKNGDYPTPYGVDRPFPDTHFGVSRPVLKDGKIRYSITAFNVDMAYRVDPTDPIALSAAMIGLRDVAVRMWQFHRKYIPGYEDSYLLQTAQKVGIREGRRIMGDYILKDKDVREGQTFPDAIGQCGGLCDIHDPDGGKAPITLLEIGNSGWYHIPYRILLPHGIDGMLVAGRCVSAERIANASIRGQGACMVTGQAAGTAAALAVKKGVTPRTVPVEELRRLLVAQGSSIFATAQEAGRF